MEDERKEVDHRWKRATKRADVFIQTFEECYEFTQPQRPSFYEEVEGERRDHRIYDSGPVTMTAEFANRMQAGLAPEGSRWAALVGGPDLSDDEKAATRADFEAVTNTVFEAIHESNFGDALNEVLLDLSVGTGGMIVNDNHSTGRIENIPVPLPFLRIDNGPDGKVDTNFRTQRLKADDIPVLWGKNALIPGCMTDAEGQNKEHIVRDVVYRDWSRLDSEVFKYKVFAEADKENFIFEDEFKGRGSNPWITARWSKAGGEAFGRGPVFNTLGDIKALNLTMQLIFENAEMAVTGMWQAIDDGVLNMDTIMFVPGVVLPTGPNGGITPLQPGGSFDVSMLILNEMRQNIRKALYSDTLGTPEGTPMSATEVAQRMAELARTVGAPLSRLWHELFVPYLERVVYLLNKRGDIDLPRINDRIISVTAQSPLARAARNEDITQFANFAGLVGQIFGPQSAQMYMKDDKAIPQLAEWYSVPASWLRNTQERQQLAQQGLQAAGQAQEAGLDPTALLQGNLP